MSEPKHTPWRYEIDADTQEPRVYALQPDNPLREQLIAVVGHYQEDVSTAEPKARLIAAAPELYEALRFAGKAIAVWLDDEEDNPDSNQGLLDAFAEIDAAIAKAEGRL